MKKIYFSESIDLFLLENKLESDFVRYRSVSNSRILLFGNEINNFTDNFTDSFQQDALL